MRGMSCLTSPGSYSSVISPAVLPTAKRWTRPSPSTPRMRWASSGLRLTRSLFPSVVNSMMKRFMEPRRRSGPTSGMHLTMPTPRRQGARSRVAACVCCLLVSCAAFAAPPHEGRYARQLAEECDQLIGLAVKRPYGWAWTARVADGAGDRKPQVEMRPPGTPGAGLVLLWAGVLLEDSRYTEAAVHVARGMVASQAANGNVVSRPAFAMAQPTKREPPGDVPDRAATRAAVALLLAARGAEESKDEMFKRAAVRAAAWLANQQSDDGGWPGAPPEGMSKRVIRLDDRDVRDSLLALVLAAGAVDDRPATVAARRAADKLIALRISAGDRWSNLWSSIYQPDGSLVDELDEFPPGADVLASRRVADALLAAGLLLDHEPARVAASDAARSLARLRDGRGEWTRLYVLEGEQPAPVGESVFGPATTQARDEMFAAGTFGVPRFLD